MPRKINKHTATPSKAKEKPKTTLDRLLVVTLRLKVAEDEVARLKKKLYATAEELSL